MTYSHSGNSYTLINGISVLGSKVIMGTKNEPNYAMEKSKYFNRLDEAFRMLCLSISRDILFHVDNITTPNEFCLNIESPFENTDEM